MTQAENSISRRSFIKSVAGASVAAQALGGFNLLADEKTGRKIKVALVGCGGRGNGALKDCHEAAKALGLELEVVAAADVYGGKAKDTGGRYGVPAERCFEGFDAYKKLLDTPAELVLLATPPAFRPGHLEAAINGGKHVFMEKPVAVDPPGARRVIAAGAQATGKNLSIVAGTQRRHDRNYRKIAAAVKDGAIGSIVGGTVMWCGGRLWFKTREAGEDDAHYMVRNWTSFTEMSGDHIVEQHVHNIDIANWFIGHPPVAAIGFGGRARRKTGDQFDFFSVDFDYGDGCHIHSMCRQVDGTYTRVGEFFAGTEGTTSGNGGLKSSKSVTLTDVPGHDNPYVQEHIDLLQSIVDAKPINEARQVAESTLAAIMGRISTYTGQLVRWVDVAEKQDSPWYNFTLKPAADDFLAGPVTAPADNVIAIPGQG